jgi:hypothetical protein
MWIWWLREASCTTQQTCQEHQVGSSSDGILPALPLVMLLHTL